MTPSIVDRAIVFATEAHAGAFRKGKNIPYIVHTLEAMAIVSSISDDPEILAAAALHDVVEDTDVSLDQLRELFGNRVADLVGADTHRDIDSTSWRERRQATMDRLFKGCHDARIVALGDKLSNLRAFAADIANGETHLWDRFHANGRADIEWYYRSLAHTFADLADSAPYAEFVRLLDIVFPPEAKADTISLNDYDEFGGGFNAVSYNHHDGHTMIKLYSEGIPLAVPLRELQCAQAVLQMGIPTPHPLRFITDGARYGVEFERLDGKVSFSRAISRDPSLLEPLTVRFAQMCLQLHSTPCRKDLFPSQNAVAKQIIADSPHFNADEKAHMSAFFASVPEADTCLHGDMHIGNVLRAGSNDYWIDLGDFACGNPLYDIGMLFLVCRCNPGDRSQHIFHLDNHQMERIWTVFVNEYYHSSSPADIAAIERSAAPFAALKMAYYANLTQMDSQMEQFIRQTLLA